LPAHGDHGEFDPAFDPLSEEALPGGEAARHALVLVATPIGNLSDFSQRAIEVLKTANLVLCEDTRTSGKLLQHFGIATRCAALHEHNEDAAIPGLIARMQRGEVMALISDAGTPLVSDPGYRLVRAALAAGLGVSGAPGANAAVLALTLSGLPPHPFLFGGFLPPKAGARVEVFRKYRAAEQAGLAATLIFYEAPHRLLESLGDAGSVFGARAGAVARELTKRFEEVVRGDLGELAAHFERVAPRGEITLLIGPPLDAALDEAELERLLVAALAQHSVREAADLVAAATGIARKKVYTAALRLAGRD